LQGESPTSFVKLCKEMLLQNQLKAGETLVVATPHRYDVEYTSALIDAATEIGAVGAQIVPIPKSNGNSLMKGLTAWHWDLYASADLLITMWIGAYPYGNPNLPGPGSGYMEKVGRHPYRTDFEFICRAGSKTRWLEIFMDTRLHRQYFPTIERQRITFDGAKIIDKAKELRITSDSGSDLILKKAGRPGHAQCGISDAPGRWDNFGFGCVACAPEEYSAEGKAVLDPGDIVPDLKPFSILTETVKLTFSGGYVTGVEGGSEATRFSKLLASYNDKESYGTSHLGWGTHEKATMGSGLFEDINAYHHNAAGTILFSLGRNYGHGLGGKETNYSGMGKTTRQSKSHTHFTLLNASFYCDSEKVVDKGKLLTQ
jgi:hypothetical protein